jgi:pimeloyl-ACP methyl ester carboxylesterase
MKEHTSASPAIFLHGLESSSQGYKARLLRELFPQILTPDFRGTLAQRMEQLSPVLGNHLNWVIIGSSFGGLMGALWTCAHPHQVRRLVLLAPALSRPDFADSPPAPVDVPVVLYHGQHDSVVPLEPVRHLAMQVFSNLTLHVVDDDHLLRATVQQIDWHSLLA